MQRGGSATHNRWHERSIVLSHHYIHQGNRIRMQVSFLTGKKSHYYHRTFTKFAIRATSGTVEASDFPEHGLVRDGTPCGDNLVCVNQTCVSIFPYIDTTKCPVSHNNVECSANGVSSLTFFILQHFQCPHFQVCTNANKCFCNLGWSGTDCSIQVDISTTNAPVVVFTQDSSIKMEKKETPYGEQEAL